MSKARAKGTRGENHFLEKLRTIWPEIERAPLKGTQDKGDFVNVPHPVEAKNCARPLFLQWVRTLRKKSSSHRWVLLYKGDARTEDGRPLAVMDAEYAYDLLHAYWSPFGQLARAEARGEIESIDLTPPPPAWGSPTIDAQVDNDGNPIASATTAATPDEYLMHGIGAMGFGPLGLDL